MFIECWRETGQKHTGLGAEKKELGNFSPSLQSLASAGEVPSTIGI